MAVTRLCLDGPPQRIEDWTILGVWQFQETADRDKERKDRVLSV